MTIKAQNKIDEGQILTETQASKRNEVWRVEMRDLQGISQMKSLDLMVVQVIVIVTCMSEGLKVLVIIFHSIRRGQAISVTLSERLQRTNYLAGEQVLIRIWTYLITLVRALKNFHLINLLVWTESYEWQIHMNFEQILLKHTWTNSLNCTT